jgi:uncharacterized membrane protein
MKKQFFIILAIHLITSGLSVSLLAFRIIRVDAGYFLFLVWNLFLAWMPLLFATAAFITRRKVSGAVGFGLLWLLFLPNAPYILTDLIHLQWVSGVPIWYDLSMFLAFAFTGLLLGLTSLHLMHTVVEERSGRLVGWLFVVAAMGLSGFGIYLGRFMRWNSWDVIINPLSLAQDLFSLVRHPIQNIESYFISAVFAAIFLLGYIIIISLGSFQKAAVQQKGF